MKKFLMIGALALTLVFTANVQESKAQSQAEILGALGFTDAQVAQVLELMGATPVVTTGESLLSDHDGVNLQVGVNSPRVMELQACMNQAGYNTGRVDGAFGPNTAAGVRSFQATQGLVVDGIVGVATTPAFQAACPVMVAAPVAGTLPAGCTSTEGFSVTTGERCDSEDPSEPEDTQFDINEGEEADFSDVDVEDADDDTLEEGQNEAELAEVEFELEEGGAALLERMDVILNYGGGINGEEDAWEVFDTIYLMVDGEIIAEESSDDEDDWEDSDVGDETRFRMSGINHVFDAEEEHVVTVAADIAGSIDFDGTSAPWTFTLVNTGMRFVDEAGITLYLDEDSAASTDTATFVIEEEGQDDELDVRSSNNDPESTTLKVEDDEASDDYTVFVFELEADEDSGDLDVDKVAITVNTTGGYYNQIVKDEEILIDGESFDDVTVFNGGDTDFSGTITDGTDGTPTETESLVSVVLVFDVDEDFTIEADETVEVELSLEFKSADGSASNYLPRATVQAQASSDDAAFDTTDITADGSNRVIANGTATGGIHTLLVEGINAETDSFNEVVTSVDGLDNDYVTFEMVVNVDAFEDDAFISQNVSTALNWAIVGTDGNGGVVNLVNAGIASLSSDANEEGNFFRINENDTEKLTLMVTYKPGDGASNTTDGGSFRLVLSQIDFATTENGTVENYSTIPSEDYRTGFATIID